MKCGEIYRLSNDFWQIYRNSGILNVKDEYSVMLCEKRRIFHFPKAPIKLNSLYFTYYVNKYNMKALNEIKNNNNCIMKDCDGKLATFIGNEHEIFAQRRKKLYPEYFGQKHDEMNDTESTRGSSKCS